MLFRKAWRTGLIRTLRKPLLLGTGWACVGLGFIGVIMPILPTTPFLLVAVWAFSKSSPEMAERIRNHPVAGRFVRDWQDEGIIPIPAKLIAVTMMTAMLGYLHFLSDVPGWAVICAAAVLAAVALYIVTRPSRRRAD
jgi:uncharacterized protein